MQFSTDTRHALGYRHVHDQQAGIPGKLDKFRLAAVLITREYDDLSADSNAKCYRWDDSVRYVHGFYLNRAVVIAEHSVWFRIF